MWLVIKEIKHNRSYFDDSDIGISAQGFEMTRSKKLKGKRAKLMRRWSFQQIIGIYYKETSCRQFAEGII